jgi:hypothetical protein
VTKFETVSGNRLTEKTSAGPIAAPKLTGVGQRRVRKIPNSAKAIGSSGALAPPKPARPCGARPLLRCACYLSRFTSHCPTLALIVALR